MWVSVVVFVKVFMLISSLSGREKSAYIGVGRDEIW